MLAVNQHGELSGKLVALRACGVFSFAVSKTVHFARYWLPVICWMVLIFTASSDRFSFEHTSRFIAPLTHYLLPQLTGEQVHAVVVGVRKVAHLTEYGVLAALVLRLIRHRVAGPARPWQWSEAALAMLVVLVYASTDEFHQLFVPTREGSLRDVGIDCVGAVLALLLLWFLGRWRKSW